jgi:hypothetical protein
MGTIGNPESFADGLERVKKERKIDDVMKGDPLYEEMQDISGDPTTAGVLTKMYRKKLNNKPSEMVVEHDGNRISFNRKLAEVLLAAIAACEFSDKQGE